MPRIPSFYMDMVFYLYSSVEAAEIGDNKGGTGFCIAEQFKDGSENAFIYGITNRHVAWGGASIIRMNCKDGTTDIIELNPDQWIVHPSGDDLAIVHLGIKPDHKVYYVSTKTFATEEAFNAGKFGVGDAAFMVSRFVAHDGISTNVPAVGFGNISIPPSLMKRSDGGDQLSFGVEMRSMRGASGSPVFTYTEPWDMGQNRTVIGNQELRFLGVDWGQIVHPVEVKEHTIQMEESGLGANERIGKFIKLNTGMNGVIPAWKVRELLDIPGFVQARAEYEEKWANLNQPKAEPMEMNSPRS